MSPELDPFSPPADWPRVRMVDEITHDDPPRIEGKTYEECVLEGPTILAPQGKGSFEHCIFGVMESDLESIIWEVRNVPRGIVGVIPLIDCVLRRVYTAGIGFAGTAEFADQMRNAIGVQAVGAPSVRAATINYNTYNASQGGIIFAGPVQAETLTVLAQGQPEIAATLAQAQAVIGIASIDDDQKRKLLDLVREIESEAGATNPDKGRIGDRLTKLASVAAAVPGLVEVVDKLGHLLGAG